VAARKPVADASLRAADMSFGLLMVTGNATGEPLFLARVADPLTS
jgi:hypothetical protein